MFGLGDSAFENSDFEDVDCWVHDKHVGGDECDRIEHIDDLVPEIRVDCSNGLTDERSREAFFTIREVRDESHDDVDRSDSDHGDPPKTEKVLRLLHGLVDGDNHAHSFECEDSGAEIQKILILVEGNSA